MTVKEYATANHISVQAVYAQIRRYKKDLKNISKKDGQLYLDKSIISFLNEKKLKVKKPPQPQETKKEIEILKKKIKLLEESNFNLENQIYEMQGIIQELELIIKEEANKGLLKKIFR